MADDDKIEQLTNELEKLPEDDQVPTLIDILGKIAGDHIAAMQAAFIEWKHGAGADAAMEWIVGQLDGPGLLPGYLADPDPWADAHPQWATSATLWWASHRSNPWPDCACGRPSSYMGEGRAWCSPEHEGLGYSSVMQTGPDADELGLKP